MIQYLISVTLLLCSIISSGQNAKMILQKSYDKCQSVQNGYYEMSRYWKSVSKKDTSKTDYNCYFKKLEEDTLYPSAFHYQTFSKNKYIADVIYTGDDFVTTSVKDSSGTIMPKSLWAKEIKSYAHNYKFYSPLTNPKSTLLPHDSALVSNEYIIKYIAEENINGELCYHIQVNQIPENDTAETLEIFRIEKHLWIKKEDFIPVQYSIAIDMFMNNDTMYQYERGLLHKYEVNSLNDENVLTLNSIPSFYTIKDYVPYKSPDLLPEETIAPDWELPSLTDEIISLKSLEGQLVLIDFFYKACFPCMQALPALQALSEKYKGKGLKVVGIDPKDTNKDDLASFLSRRGITYTVLLDEKEDTATDYHVSGYPTMYLISKTGKIIFVQEGYGKDVDALLDEIIQKNL